MNWVGGARSRVKQQNERKIQKEFFERKRLMKKLRTRPTSPGEGRMRTAISQDLLFVQTLNNVHGRDVGSRHKQERPRKPIKVDLDASCRNARRPERNLELPMSPIGKPSTLNFLDTTMVSSLDLSGFKDQPRVSTQKVPHQTVLQTFGPAHQSRIEKENNRYPALDRIQPTMTSVLNAPTMPETVIRKRPPYLAKGLSNSTAGGSHYKWKGEHGLTNDTISGKGKHSAEVLERTRSKHSTWKRSNTYDHETPFDFEARGTKKPRLQQLPLQSKASLLDFHHKQGGDGTNKRMESKSLGVSKQQSRGHFWKRHVPVATKHPEESATVNNMEAALPTLQASEPKAIQSTFTIPGCTSWCNSKANFGSSMRASTESFVEEPLRKATTCTEPPKSTSTVFDESILGPISRHRRNNVVNHVSTCTHKNPPGQEKAKVLSTFERMMLFIEQDRPLTARSPACDVDVGGGGGKGPKGIRDTTFSGAQHMEWRKFTMAEPLNELAKQTVVRENEAKRPPLDLCSNLSNSQEKAPKQMDKLKKPLKGCSNSRKNITVMEELFCLEEELTSSLESENTLPASQDIPLTPPHLLFSEEPIRRVPDARNKKPTAAKEDASGSQEDARSTYAEVPLCSQDRERFPGDGEVIVKGANIQPLHVVPHGNSCSSQTDDCLTKEISCECDIWSAETVHVNSRVRDIGTQSSLFPAKQASTQTNTASPWVECAVQTDTLQYTRAPLPAAWHSDDNHRVPPLENKELQTTPFERARDDDDGKSSKYLRELETQVSQLREELHTAQSTVIWQSLMLRLHQGE